MQVYATVTALVLTVILTVMLAATGVSFKAGNGTHLFAPTALGLPKKCLLNTKHYTNIMSNPVTKKGSVNVRSIAESSDSCHSPLQSKLGSIMNRSKVPPAELEKIKEAAKIPRHNRSPVIESPPPSK